MGRRAGPGLRGRPADLLDAARLREGRARARRPRRRDDEGQGARPARVAGGARGQRLQAVPRRRSRTMSSCATATSPASPASTIPTTCCSTTSSPGSRPPSCARCSPSCATRSSRSSPPPATADQPRNDGAFQGEFDAEAQRVAVLDVLEALGFDPDSWRLDPTLHPFASGISTDDVRLTTRYDEQDFAVALYSALHEFGHGLYEASFAPELRRTTLDDAVSLGIHESQSRMWENMVGRSRPFCAWLLPRLNTTLPGSVAGLDATALYRAVNTVQPSLDPHRRRRDDLQPPHHPALRARARADRGLARGRRRCPRPGTRRLSGCSASRSRRRSRASCRTSTGATG